jgi:ABC-type phosphate/phosphonate transport system substrate-binding protein
VVRASRLFVAFVLILAVGAIPRVEALDPPNPLLKKIPDVKIGLPKPMFKDIPDAMVQIGATPLTQMIQKLASVNGLVELFPDYRALAASLKDGKIDVAIFHGFEYAWVKDTPGMVPLVVTVPNCGKVQAILVVNVKSKVTEPKELKGACILVPKCSKAHCDMFLDRIRCELPAGDCCPAKRADLTPDEALCAVARDESEAALVDVASLIALEKYKQAAFKRLRILSQSVPLPPAVVVYRRGALDPEAIIRIRDGLIEAPKTPIGQTFSLLWQLKGFEDVSPTYNKLVEESLKAYPIPVEKPKPMPTPVVGGP